MNQEKNILYWKIIFIRSRVMCVLQISYVQYLICIPRHIHTQCEHNKSTYKWRLRGDPKLIQIRKISHKWLLLLLWPMPHIIYHHTQSNIPNTQKNVDILRKTYLMYMTKGTRTVDTHVWKSTIKSESITTTYLEIQFFHSSVFSSFVSFRLNIQSRQHSLLFLYYIVCILASNIVRMSQEKKKNSYTQVTKYVLWYLLFNRHLTVQWYVKDMYRL